MVRYLYIAVYGWWFPRVYLFRGNCSSGLSAWWRWNLAWEHLLKICGVSSPLYVREGWVSRKVCAVGNGWCSTHPIQTGVATFEWTLG